MDLVIRRTEPTDYEALYQIFSGARVVWGTLQLPYPSLDTWRKRLAAPPDGLYSLVACQAQEVLGHLDLHTFPNHPRRRHAGEVGMAVRETAHGQGVGTALMRAAVDVADGWLNLARLELSVYTDNEPALRLYKKFGFEVEGRLVRFGYRDGQYVDAYMLARFKPE